MMERFHSNMCALYHPSSIPSVIERNPPTPDMADVVQTNVTQSWQCGNHIHQMLGSHSTQCHGAMTHGGHSTTSHVCDHHRQYTVHVRASLIHIHPAIMERSFSMRNVRDSMKTSGVTPLSLIEMISSYLVSH